MPSADDEGLRLTWITRAAFGSMSVAVLVAVVFDIAVNGGVWDFQVNLNASERLLAHGSPYDHATGPASGLVYAYPPLTAILTIPMTVLPTRAAELLVVGSVVAASLAIPVVLGVRDWPCIGSVLLWPPVVHGIQTGNVTIFVALGAALVWRWRDRAGRAGLALGLGFAIKPLLWPVALWLLATRRFAAAAWTVIFGSVLVLAPWAAIGFAGLTAYPDLLRRMSAAFDERAYSLYGVMLDLGASPPIARTAWLALAAALVSAVVVFASRRRDREAFILALAATLAASPYVWYGYFVLLLVIVAVAQPSLGLLWVLTPTLLWITAGTYNPTTFEAAGTLVVAAATVALALGDVSKRPTEASAMPDFVQTTRV